MPKTLEEIEAAHAARAARKAAASSVTDDLDFSRRASAPADPAGGDDDLPPTEGDDTPPPADEPDELDQLTAENAKLQQQLAALQGRVAPSQRQADEYRSLYEQERRSREQDQQNLTQQIEDLRRQLEERSARIDVNELLTEDERVMFDEGQLNVISKMATAVAKARMPRIDVEAETRRVIQQREAKEVEDFRNELLSDPRSELAQLSTLAQNHEFLAWAGQDENDDFDPLVRAFLKAGSKREVERLGKSVAKRIARYNEVRNGKATTRPTDARTTSLERASQRRPRRYSDEEKQALFAQAKQLARSKNPEDRKKAQELIDKL